MLRSDLLVVNEIDLAPMSASTCHRCSQRPMPCGTDGPWSPQTHGKAAESTSTTRAACARATLRFAVAGGRTRLLRQHAPHPFHVTRPFYLNPERPDLAALYLQSASGGIYSGEHLELVISAGKNTVAAVTTQSANSSDSLPR